MKIAIFCGGKGTRLREKTAVIPKPLAEIGDIPIITHLMVRYLYYGFTDFLLLIGYKGEKIIDYFEKQKSREYPDIKKLGVGSLLEKHVPKIEYFDTGVETSMWDRLLRAETKLKGHTFMANYADGLANINLGEILDYHKKHGKTGTVAVVKPHSQYGKVVIRDKVRVTSFIEKPVQSFWVNGGFFIFNKNYFSALETGKDLSVQPLDILAKEGELFAFKHKGFWKCMDTFKDLNQFNEYFQKGEAKWLMFK